jgi:sterol desaturase/sphingolipid hydroxylase (fatty acid hydroxylase superfamily)
MIALLPMVVTVALLAVVFVPLERVFPARRGQPVFRRDWLTDATFLAGQYLVWNATAFAALGAVERLIARIALGLHAEIAQLPVAVQAIAAVVLGDLCVYGFHRACHSFEPLWRIHAVHHSTEELDWLAAHREHPLDGIGTALSANLPAFLIGFDVKMLAALSVFRGLRSIFIHSNVRLPLGPLRWVVGAPELHHWHHAKVERTAHNFGNTAPYLDVLFGTHHCPRGDETYALGLTGPWPRGYLAQLVAPIRAHMALRRSRLAAPPQAVTGSPLPPPRAIFWHRRAMAALLNVPDW